VDPQECDACRADHVINQEDEDVVQRVLEITGGEGAYAALDPIAGDFTGTVGQSTSHALVKLFAASRLSKHWKQPC
jgi:NADPH:quinone reductase-like Zn-dependent oxidoreductase